jgi:hypothetical protein
LAAAVQDEPPTSALARPEGATPTAIAAPTMAAAASSGVTARPATGVAPAGATALEVAKATTPAGAAATAAAGAAPADSTAAAAASAAKVLLLRLPGGRPRLRGTGGVAAGSFALFLLPNEQPRLRPPDLLGTLAPTPPRAPVDNMEAKKTSWSMLRELIGEEEE